MQASVTDPSSLEQLLPVREVTPMVQRLTHLVRKEPALLVPQLTGLFPFFALLYDV
jgi:hypothetical protein